MDFRSIAEAALERVATLTNEMRSVNEDAVLTDAEKRERIEKIDADLRSAHDEARSAVERGEREGEARSLAGRVEALTRGAGRGNSRDKGENEVAEGLRSVGRGEARSFDINTTGEFRAAAGANTAVLSNSTWAGTTVANTFVATVLESLREVSPILQSGATIITTSTGEKMEWPFKNGNIVATKVAEGAVYPRSKGSFTRFALDSFKYGVIAEATQEMVNDSAIPLEAIIAKDMGDGIADATNADFLKGDGTTAPHGIVPATTLSTAIANAAAFNTDALITLQYSVRPKYRNNASYYISDDAALKMRLLKDLQGRYLWEPSVQAGRPATFNGFNVVEDYYMDGVTGAGKVPVLFGDFSKYLVRFVGGVNVSRSEEYGWDADVIGYKANVRVDGGLTDAAAVAKLTVTA